MEHNSHFDGTVIGFIGIQIGVFLITVFTFGFGIPWAVAMKYRWVTSHSVIEGRRLRFTGSGASLAWKWFKIWALTIITLGIYGFWAFNALQRWRLSHTTFA